MSSDIDHFNDKEKITPQIYPFLQHYVNTIRMDQNSVVVTDSLQQIFINMITDKTFMDNEVFYISTVAIFFEAIQFDIEHGVRDMSIQMRVEEYLHQLGLSDEEFYKYENDDNIPTKQLTDRGKSFEDQMIETIAKVDQTNEPMPFDYMLTNGSIHVMFDLLSAIYACHQSEVDIDTYFEELGID